MAMLVKMAWRNVWRHKARSGVIVVSVAFGIWAGLFMQGYLNGMVEQRIRTAISKELAHIQVHHPMFKSNYEQRYIIPGQERLLETLRASPGVKGVSPRLIAQAMVSSATSSGGVMVKGVDPAMERQVTSMSENITEGAWFPGKSKNEAVVGERLLKKYKLRLNSKMVLTLVDSSGTITAGAFRIRGVYRTDNAPYDETTVFVRSGDLSVLTATGHALNEVAVLLHSNDSVAGVQKHLREQFPALLTENWKEIAPEMDLVISSVNQSMIIFMIIIMLALAFGIINTMLMAVLERTREIGMMMALGMDKTRVFFMILLETAFLILSGLPAGVLGGFATIAWFGRRGIHLSDQAEVMASFGYSSSIYPVLSTSDYTTMILMVVATVCVSALFPARRALRMVPSEAIRK